MLTAIEQEIQLSGKYVINHDIMNCTADGVMGNHLYSGRALGLSEPWDIIQLHPELKSQWDDIRAHYLRVGLPHSENVIWNLDLKHLGMHIGFQPSVFFFGPNEYTYWGDHAWMETVDYINSKNNFMTLAHQLGVDVPETSCFASVNEIRAADIMQLTYPCYLKAAVSVSGVGIYRCENRDEFQAAMTKFAPGVPVQIQEEIITDTFLNLQYRVNGKELQRLTASEQILDGFTHQGNRVPASHEPWASVDPMAEWLMANGIKGIFAFDLAVVQTDRGLRFPAIECNPRFNGASYPTLIASKMDIPEWSARSFNTRYRSLDEINLKDLEFDIDTGEGAILVNWGTILVGKLMILLAGSREYQEALALELEARL